MRAAWMCATASTRMRWGSVIVLTLLVGFIGAVVLTAFAGARRTESSFDRFRAETKEADLIVFSPAADRKSIAHLRAFPGVRSIALAQPLLAAVNEQGVANVGGPMEPGVGTTVDRPRLLEGRRPHQDRADEIAIPEPLAESQGLHVGDTTTIHGYTEAQVGLIILQNKPAGKPAGPKVPVRVVGITRAPSDLSILGTEGGLLMVTREFERQHGDQIGGFAPYVLIVRLSDPGAATRFVQEARALLAHKGPPGEFQVEPTSETEGAVQQSIDVTATALLVSGVTAALVGLVVAAIVLRRFVDGGSTDLVALRGLGVSRFGRVLVVALPVVPIALGGGLLALVLGWAASPLMPIGLARQAEPNLGLDFDPLVVGLGALAVVVVVLGVALVAARRAVVAELVSEDAPGTRLSRAAAGAGLAPPVTVGVSMALESRRGVTSVPVRSAIGGAVFAVAGVVAVMVFAASLGALTRTPSAYGYNWDANVVVNHPKRLDAKHPCASVRSGLLTKGSAVAHFVDDRAVAAVAAVCSDSGEVEGHPITFYAFRSLEGSVTPTVLDGRAPRAKGEVALGHDTLGKIDAAIGDRVKIAGPNGHATYRVVGAVALPLLASPAGEPANAQAIADGAVLTDAGIDSVSKTTEGPLPLVVRWKAGADVTAARGRIRAAGGAPLSAVLPLEVDRLDQLDALPWALGSFLAIIGIAGVGYALVAGVRRRRQEFAVLKTIGFRRSQLGATVATQAVVLGGIGLLVGVPLGIIVGRAVWKAVARGAGLASTDTVPALAVVILVVATIVIVNLIALAPARRAARLRPAVVLRSE